MLDRRKYFESKFDYLRTTLTQEPRFFPGVVAFVVPPCNSKVADYGVIFADYRGYADMCIHGTIGIVTTLYERGLLKSGSKNPIVSFDTAAGIVRAKANIVKGGRRRINSVSVSNVPSFYLGSTAVQDASFGKITSDIAFGGNLYAYVNIAKCGLEVVPKNLHRFLELASTLLVKIKHSKIVLERRKSISLNSLLGVSFYEDLGPGKARNVMIASDGMFDRSPCGTGTCGRMAVLHAQGKLRVNQNFVNQSIIGSEFVGKIKGETKSGEAIEPEVTGTAHLTGVSDVIVSKGDTLSSGFLVN